ncbi:hypothetical protein CVU37_14765 [candidate division BRC1 bacterium HGW-BRC1-1]|jgi:hypothetical protein|nr:MAG: hypothetical protein CVU37_14765 [candidate division BRC1 bacterium HGW-BRC1-1]
MNHITISRLLGASRLATLMLCAIAILALAGCTKTVSVDLLDKPLPVLSEGEPEVGMVSTVGTNRVQLISMSDNSNTLGERYADWFKKNGWSQISQSANVNTASWILGRDSSQTIIDYAAGTGTKIRITTPDKQ